MLFFNMLDFLINLWVIYNEDVFELSIKGIYYHIFNILFKLYI